MLGEILSAVGGILGLGARKSEAAADRQMQLDAAQNQVQWRVADATKAGLHPLAALGMNPVSMSPVAVGDVAGTMSNIGQDIGRAVDAGSTKTQQAGRLATMIAQTQLEGLGLDNDIKRAELASRVRRSLGPAAGSPVRPVPTPNTARGADVGGQTLPTPGGMPDWITGQDATAEEVERQYGDVIQEIYGAGRLFNDTVKNVNRNQTVKAVDDRIKYFLNELFGITPAY